MKLMQGELHDLTLAIEGSHPNDNLEQFNIGLEMGILNNRVSAVVEYYRQNTHDLLMSRQLPPTSGFTETLQNIGETRNTGWEFTLSVDGKIRVADVFGEHFTVALQVADEFMIEVLVRSATTNGTGEIYLGAGWI